MAGRLEATANTAVILACVIFGVHYGTDFYSRTHPAPPTSPYKAGDTIDDTPELGFKLAGMTMVLVTPE